jgi:hypothetical protein
MTTEFTVEAVISARPLVIYAAWLDGKSHTNMTGGEVTGEPTVAASSLPGMGISPVKTWNLSQLAAFYSRGEPVSSPTTTKTP